MTDGSGIAILRVYSIYLDSQKNDRDPFNVKSVPASNISGIFELPGPKLESYIEASTLGFLFCIQLSRRGCVNQHPHEIFWRVRYYLWHL